MWEVASYYNYELVCRCDTKELIFFNKEPKKVNGGNIK